MELLLEQVNLEGGAPHADADNLYAALQVGPPLYRSIYLIDVRGGVMAMRAKGAERLDYWSGLVLHERKPCQQLDSQSGSSRNCLETTVSAGARQCFVDSAATLTDALKAVHARCALSGAQLDRSAS